MSSAIRIIDVKENILSDNEALASEIRENLKTKKTFLLNLMSSPGAGKTTLILKIIELLRQTYKIAVIEADIDSAVDAEKISATGIKAVQLRTGGLCHLDASMVAKALETLEESEYDLVIIENIGNLVCPAEFDTGAIKNAMILSVPEGDDKPLKYPLMFRVTDVLIINKIDTISLFDFDFNAFKKRVLKLNQSIKILDVSAKTGLGLDTLIDWLRNEIDNFIN